MSNQIIIKRRDLLVTYDTIDSMIYIESNLHVFCISIPRCEFVAETQNIYVIYDDMKLYFADKSSYCFVLKDNILRLKKLIYIRVNFNSNYKFYNLRGDLTDKNTIYFYNNEDKIYLEWDNQLGDYLLSADHHKFYDFESFSTSPLKLALIREDDES